MARTGKRANGEGSIYWVAGREAWAASFSFTEQGTGKARRRTVYGKTQAEARRKLKEGQSRAEAGRPVADAKISLGDYALNTWSTTTLEVEDLKPTTRENYRSVTRNHIAGRAIGAKTLDRLTPTDVETLLVEMRDAGLSQSTQRLTYAALRKILATAVRDGLVARNVAEAISRPKVEHKDARYLSTTEVRAFLDAAQGRRYARVLEFIAYTGVRRGEALALTWERVAENADGVSGQAHIAGTLSRVGGALVTTAPKSARSRRVVPLHGRAFAVLAEERAAQAAERAIAGPEWEDHGLVFATERGKPVDPRNILRLAIETAHRAGLGDGVGVHTLRHTAAATMLLRGIPLPDVSRVLGHSSTAITDTHYGHITPQAQSDALAALAGAY